MRPPGKPDKLGYLLRITFERPGPFYHEVKTRVADYLATAGARPRDLPLMYLKTATILAWLAASYLALVFAAQTWWQVAGSGLSLVLALGAVGFNIHHDASHGGFSDSKRVGRAMAFALDLIGGSSYVWRWKHNVFHHTYPNVTGADDDINIGWLARLAPQQTRHGFHRFQHFYMWLLYGFLPFKWQLMDDFKDVLRAHVGTRPIPRPRGWELVLFVAGKAVFLSLAFAVPLLVHPWWAVAAGYAATFFAVGIILSVIFQLAHCVEGAEFPALEAETQRVPAEWALLQVRTTVDFAPRSRLLTAYLGGLNYQIEHHLFPRVCHLHYPKIAPIVEEACRRHGVPYNAQPGLWSALASHYRWLRAMGRPAPQPA